MNAATKTNRLNDARIANYSSKVERALRAQVAELTAEMIAAQEAGNAGEALACRNALRDLEARGIR